jgi:hypothetical protein
MSNIQLPPSDDERIQALRDSVLGPEIAQDKDGNIGIKVTEKDFESKPVPQAVQDLKGPHIMNQLLQEATKKKIPLLSIYITEVDGVPVVNFVTTMGGGESTAEMMKHVIEENKAKFGK